ncbi:MAG: hypothetical protein F6J93_01310 [Oscillatoria sp. SIO1A7]|nr:hypothetical protein [Oscillatoria sp. SIO1A7]
MTKSKRIPDPEMFERSAECFREVCRKLDALNLVLDDAIAQMDAINRSSPLYIRRLERAKRLLDSQRQPESAENGIGRKA